MILFFSIKILSENNVHNIKEIANLRLEDKLFLYNFLKNINLNKEKEKT